MIFQAQPSLRSTVAAGALLFGFAASAHAQDQDLLDALGVMVVDREVSDTWGGRFVAPRFCDVAYDLNETVGRSAVAFLSLPGSDDYWPPTDGGALDDLFADHAPWRADYETPRWPDGDVLVYEQVEGRHWLSGEISISLPKSLVAEGITTLTVDQIQGGCVIECSSPVPFELTETPMTLQFDWNTHHHVSPSGLSTTLHTEEGIELPPIWAEVKMPRPPILATQSALVFESYAQKHQVTFSSLTGEPVKLMNVIGPGCLHANHLARDGSGAERLEFSQTHGATMRHNCQSVLVELLAGDDPEPYFRFLNLQHDMPIMAGEERLLISGDYLIGERVKVIRMKDGRIVALRPDRLPAFAERILAGGVDLLAEFTVPYEEGAFMIEPEPLHGAGSLVRVNGLASSGATDAFQHWETY